MGKKKPKIKDGRTEGGPLVKLRRFDNWPILLSKFLTQRQKMPFTWGRNDCLLFAADCVEALTGVDLVPEYRGTYDTEARAKEILIPYGGVISGIINDRLGQPIPNPLLARRGDVCIADIGDVCACGVVDDTGARVAFLTEKGLVRGKLRDTMIFWGYG